MREIAYPFFFCASAEDWDAEIRCDEPEVRVAGRPPIAFPCIVYKRWEPDSGVTHYKPIPLVDVIGAAKNSLYSHKGELWVEGVRDGARISWNTGCKSL